MKKNDTKLYVLQLWKVQKSTMLQDKTHAPYSKKEKLKMGAMEWTDDQTFRFNNDFIWNGLGENYFLWAKDFQGNEQSFVQSRLCVSDA